MKYPKYPNDRTEANLILLAVRFGFGNHYTSHLVNYCLLMTGDLS
jgi:hypothetical protein